MGEFDGRVAFVTGAANGIGLATAELLLQRGAGVFLADIDPRVVETAAALALEHGGRATGGVLDVRSTQSVEGCVASATARFGAIDILANVAGVYPPCGLTEMDDDFLERVLDINLKGVFRTCRAIAPQMLERKRGAIVNVSSGVATKPYAGMTAYAASKGGVVSMSRSLALELAPHVRVNVVSPGATATPTVLVAMSVADNAPAQAAARNIPLQRLGEAREVAEAIAYLASDRAAYSTGSIVSVNGGNQML